MFLVWFANLLKLKHFLFLLMVIVLPNVLIWFIVMFGVCLLLLLMLIVNIVTFIIEYSHFSWIYFLKSKAEVFSMFTRFLAYVENQFQTRNNIFRFDSGGEYVSHEFKNICNKKVNCISTFMYQHTPTKWYCRVKESSLDVTRTLLLQSFSPSRSQVEALSTFAFLINRLPFTVLALDSPFFCLFKTSKLFSFTYFLGVYAMFTYLLLKDVCLELNLCSFMSQ